MILKFVCNVCDGTIESERPRKFCSSKCEQKYQRKPTDDIRHRCLCERCGKAYPYKNRDHQGYCKDCAYLKLSMDSTIDNHYGNNLINCYVYEWLDDGKVFYVGKGKKDRAWSQHTQPSEEIRRNSRNFQIRIVRANLSDRDALFLEETLIWLRLSEGCRLVNIRGITPAVD